MSDDMVTISRSDLAALAVAAQRGSALETWIATTALLGHTKPGHSLEYVHAEPWTATAFVKDFVAWTSGRKHLSPGCEERLREWGMEEAGQRMAEVTEKFGLTTGAAS